ncbi:MAG: START domain-containing protein [Candidatus Omnitrophica bacterium]|nr:START domain-containing protein [Candidatus Omnitrophota bacterium]
MKKIGAIIFVLFLCVKTVFASGFPWELKKNENGIEVSVRKVEGSPILEYKASMIVETGLEKVLAFYEEGQRMPEWFYQCVESRLLEEKSPNEKILYFVIDLPWPVKNRDSVYHRVRSQDPATGAVEFVISAVPDYLPEQDGRVRTPALKGIWRFTPLPDGRTEVYYQQHSDAGGHIPAALVNKLAVSIPYNSFFNFRKLLSE